MQIRNRHRYEGRLRNSSSGAFGLSGFLFVVVRYYVKGQDILESVLLMLTLWLMLIWTNYTEQGISQLYVIARKFPRYWKLQRRWTLILAIVVSVGFIVGYVGKHFFG